MAEMTVIVKGETHQIEQGQEIVFTHRGEENAYTTRYRIRFVPFDVLEIDGDVIRDNGESLCESIAVGPIDTYTVQVWTI